MRGAEGRGDGRCEGDEERGGEVVEGVVRNSLHGKNDRARKEAEAEEGGYGLCVAHDAVSRENVTLHMSKAWCIARGR